SLPRLQPPDRARRRQLVAAPPLPHRSRRLAGRALLRARLLLRRRALGRRLTEPRHHRSPPSPSGAQESAAVTEFIVFVLLAGLAVAEPATDYSDAVLALAPPTADVFVYADAEALVQPAWRFVRHELPRQPF